MSTLTAPSTFRELTAMEPFHPTPIRVCFLIDELAVAGTETQLLALIRQLDRSRVLPHLCLLRGDSTLSRSLEPVECPVWRLGVGSLSRVRAVLQLLRFARLLREHGIDIVQTYFPDSSYFGLPAAWLAGVPHRFRVRNNLGHWLTPTHRRLGRLLNLFTTGTLTNCQAARDALLASDKVAAPTVHVLENGVDLERFRAIPPVSTVLPPKPIVGAVANLRPVKGVDLLVSAAQLLRDSQPAVIFRVAGEGPQRGELETALATNGLADRFRLVGIAKDVPTFLAELEVAVLPSRSEGMSNALLEYMAAGRPIVATNVGGNAELIEHGVNGLLVPPNDPAELARAIESLLRDRALASRLGMAAKHRAYGHFSRKAMVQRFEYFYSGLARRRGSTIRHASEALHG